MNKIYEEIDTKEDNTDDQWAHETAFNSVIHPNNEI